MAQWTLKRKRRSCLLCIRWNLSYYWVVNSNLGNPLWASEYLDLAICLAGWLHNCAITYIHFMLWEPKLRQRSRGFPGHGAFGRATLNDFQCYPVKGRGLYSKKNQPVFLFCLRVHLLIGCIPKCIFIFCFSLPLPHSSLNQQHPLPIPIGYTLYKNLCWVFEACFTPTASAKVNRLE